MRSVATAEDRPATAEAPTDLAGPDVHGFTGHAPEPAPPREQPRVEGPDAIPEGWLIPTHLVWEIGQRAFGVMGLVLTAPLLAVAFVLMKITSPGPFLFCQLRRGYGGKPFKVYKVRSLSVNAEKSTALGVGRGESTVTPVGRVLRKLKIDEFPQFWNIARGEMNLVGPRPIPIALEDELTKHIPHFSERHRVKPGLSSFGQVTIVENKLGADLTKDWGERFEAELHYIRNKSVVYDIVVMVLTALYLVRSATSFRRSRSTSETDAQGHQTVATTEVLGTPIINLDYQGVESAVAGWIERGQSQYVGICPVHSIVEGVLRRSHREALDGAGLNTADGMPVVWAQQLLGHRKASRVYGPTLMMRLVDRAARSGWRVGFYGGAPEALNILVDRVRLKYPKLEIACAISPPFRKLEPSEDAAFVNEINASKPDLLFIGLGCPKQERWMFEHRDRLATVQLGVGAAFAFHAGQVRQAPRFLQRIGMEWAFRLACEPRRLFRRYATTNPIYVALFGLQFFKALVLRRRYQKPWRDDRARDS